MKSPPGIDIVRLTCVTLGCRSGWRARVVVSVLHEVRPAQSRQHYLPTFTLLLPPHIQPLTCPDIPSSDIPSPDFRQSQRFPVELSGVRETERSVRRKEKKSD